MDREALDRMLRVEESTTTLASAHEETERLVRTVRLHEGELVKVRQACEVVEETARGLSDVMADAERWREESRRGRQEQLEECTLL
jgi:hypothetical protein